jgi:hypothetical protein
MKTIKCDVCGYELVDVHWKQERCTIKRGNPDKIKKDSPFSTCQITYINSRSARKNPRGAYKRSAKKKNGLSAHKCLRCRKAFFPLSKYNRICDACKIDEKDTVDRVYRAYLTYRP